jgi:exopolysaccharide biosynthesis polyprenyl glycosylphosphotransferase
VEANTFFEQATSSPSEFSSESEVPTKAGWPLLDRRSIDRSVVNQVLDARAARTRSIQRSWVRLRIAFTILFDLFAALIATSLALNVRLGSRRLATNVSQVSDSFSLTYSQLSLVFVLSWCVIVFAHGGYQSRVLSGLWEQGAKLWRSAVMTLATIGVAGLFSRTQISRTYVSILLPSLVFGSFLGRLMLGWMFGVLRRLGIGMDRIVLVGPPRSTLPIRTQLETTSTRRTRVVDEVCPRGSENVTPSIVRSVNRHGATSIVVCGASALPVGTVRMIATQLGGSGVSVVIAPGTAEAVGPGVQLHAVGDLFLLRVRDSDPGVLERVTKVVFDRLVAALALVVLSPVMFVIAQMIRRSSPGPALFRQERIGKDGKVFRIYKFRSMTADAEARLRQDGLWETYVANGYKLPQGQDPRITRIGAVLRRTSLDELPQLFNVVCGQMSLVGPRPVVAEELECYEDLDSAYLGVRPGITGYWQVNGRSDIGFPERAELDAYYHDNRSFRVDLRILFRTVVAVALRVGAH